MSVLKQMRLNGKLRSCHYVKCDFHSLERGWLSGWVASWDFFFSSCSTTISMRLQVRTTNLRQRSTDRLPDIWLLLVYFWRRFFSVNHPQQVDKSIRHELLWKQMQRESGRDAKPAVIHRGNLLGVYFCLQDVLMSWMRRAPGCVFSPNKTGWKSWSKRTEPGCTVGLL